MRNTQASRDAGSMPQAARGFRYALMQGFATNIANPKSMAFYATA